MAPNCCNAAWMWVFRHISHRIVAPRSARKNNAKEFSCGTQGNSERWHVEARKTWLSNNQGGKQMIPSQMGRRSVVRQAGMAALALGTALGGGGAGRGRADSGAHLVGQGFPPTGRRHRRMALWQYG